MHNIKDIRNNFDNFKNIIKSRNITIDLDQILDRQSGQNSSDEDETSEFFQREDMSGNMSIISDGRKRRRFKDKY